MPIDDLDMRKEWPPIQINLHEAKTKTITKSTSYILFMNNKYFFRPSSEEGESRKTLEVKKKLHYEKKKRFGHMSVFACRFYHFEFEILFM